MMRLYGVGRWIVSAATVALMLGAVWIGWKMWVLLLDLPGRPPADVGPQVFDTRLWQGVIAVCGMVFSAMLVVGGIMLLARLVKKDPTPPQ